MFSDHRPISVKFVCGSSINSGGRGRKFRFEPFWLKDEECYYVICTAWGGFESDTSGRGLREQLVMCADRLENWSKVNFGSLKKAIDRKRYSLIWHFDKNGEYSVKSGYRIAAQEKLSLKGSSSCPDSKWWLAIWNLNIPPKIKIFIWRSSAHALFWCSSVRAIWESTVFWDILNLQRHISYFDLILWVFVRAKRAEFEEFCMILWGVWSDRNAVSHSKSPRFSAALVSWSLSLLREFQGTQKVFGFPSQPPRQSCPVSWSLPPAGSLKLNTDAAVKPGFSVMGSGAVVRDDQGKVVAASAMPLLGFFPAELGELLALREGFAAG
ncbi:hypothetical protein ACOSQ4_022684 [Xanthoceras sorbifolium]